MWLVYSKENDYVTDSRFSWSTKNLPVMKEGRNCLCRRAYWEWAARYEPWSSPSGEDPSWMLLFLDHGETQNLRYETGGKTL
jgi:hypothetical protein